MTGEHDLRRPGVKVALKFEQPWDVTGDLADNWQSGILADNGRVFLDMPIELEGCAFSSVIVAPRYERTDFADLNHGQPIVVNQKIETSDGDLCLIGSIRQPRA